jgi:hypothetical protein
MTNDTRQQVALTVGSQREMWRSEEQRDPATSLVIAQSDVPAQQEPFVNPEAVAGFLSITRSEVLKLTREGKIRGYAYKGYLRHLYRYRLSEVSADFAAFAYQPKGTIAGAALVRRRRKSNG